MRCAVYGCNSSNKCEKIRFFRFPKDSKLLKKWVLICNQKRFINTSLERVCFKHFLPEDIERSFQYEMGLCSRGGKLKPGTIPSVQIDPEAEPGVAENPCSTMNLAVRNEIIDPLPVERKAVVVTPNKVNEDNENTKMFSFEHIIFDDGVTTTTCSTMAATNRKFQDIEDKITCLENQLSQLHEENLSLKKGNEKQLSKLLEENLTLKKDNEMMYKEVRDLKLALRKAEFERDIFEEKFNTILKKGQIHK